MAEAVMTSAHKSHSIDNYNDSGNYNSDDGNNNENKVPFPHLITPNR